jgi:two-component system, OmpR family, phosphate regulon sensor histidine kinase PhoR
MALILIIDDDRLLRSACSRVLSKAGWNVACAETGDEGLRAIQHATEPIGAILLDQLMPGMSGTDVLAEVQAMNPDIPVVIMTGSATEESFTELKKNGAFACLPKPFTPEQLREVIHQATNTGFSQ